MVMGPLLLARGLHPAVVTAVNTTSVLFSSSSAAAKSIVRGTVPWDYCVLLCCLCFFCALVGKAYIDRIVRRISIFSLSPFPLCVCVSVYLLSVAPRAVEKAQGGTLLGGVADRHDVCVDALHAR